MINSTEKRKLYDKYGGNIRLLSNVQSSSQRLGWRGWRAPYTRQPVMIHWLCAGASQVSYYWQFSFLIICWDGPANGTSTYTPLLILLQDSSYHRLSVDGSESGIISVPIGGTVSDH